MLNNCCLNLLNGCIRIWLELKTRSWGCVYNTGVLYLHRHVPHMYIRHFLAWLMWKVLNVKQMLPKGCSGKNIIFYQSSTLFFFSVGSCLLFMQTVALTRTFYSSTTFISEFCLCNTPNAKKKKKKLPRMIKTLSISQSFHKKRS